MRQPFLPRAALAIFLCLGFAGAHAQTFYSLEYEANEKRATHHSNMFTAATLGYKAEDGNEYSVKGGIGYHSFGHGLPSEFIEVQAKTYFLVTDRAQPYAALGIGDFSKRAGNFGYLFATAGVKLPMTASTLVDFGSTWIGADDVDRIYYITRLYATFAFGLTPHDWISVRASHCVGVRAVEQDSLRLMYTRFF